jgi:hypothetical protein
MRYEIHQTALKHGISDDDILHAIEFARFVARLDDQRLMHLGPDTAANMLEVVTLAIDDEIHLVIHAMKMRPKYRTQLRGLGETDA